MADEETICDLLDRIRPILAGHKPPVQGFVLADLLATLLAGQDPAVRDDLLAMHIRAVRDLVPVNEALYRPDCKRRST